MKVFLVIVAFAALTLCTQTQETFNRHQHNTRWNASRWDRPDFNRTQWNPTAFNRTHWNNNPHQFNRTWANHPHPIKNITIPNWPKWNITSPHGVAHRPRPRRSEPEGEPKYAYFNHNQTTHNGDLILGNVGYLDRLLFNRTYVKERRWWSGREKIIEYPRDLPGKYNTHRQETIAAVRIYNKFLDGLEADAKILAGGVGYRYVKIELSSPWNRGFKYLVQLFGH